jgi:hypothetical protein
MDRFFVGVDLGQSSDYTTIAIIERKELMGAWDGALWAHRKEISLRLRHIERIELGTTYPQVVQRIIQVTRRKELEGRCELVVDGSGVGRPVVDALVDADPGCEMMAVTATGGLEETRSGSNYMVPKRDLITGLQVLLQNGELGFAGGLKWRDALIEEMSSMEVKMTATGREQFGARSGGHDDLVAAVALACWAIRKRYRGVKPGHWTNEQAEWRWKW